MIAQKNHDNVHISKVLSVRAHFCACACVLAGICMQLHVKCVCKRSLSHLRVSRFYLNLVASAFPKL